MLCNQVNLEKYPSNIRTPDVNEIVTYGDMDGDPTKFLQQFISDSIFSLSEKQYEEFADIYKSLFLLSLKIEWQEEIDKTEQDLKKYEEKFNALKKSLTDNKKALEQFKEKFSSYALLQAESIIKKEETSIANIFTSLKKLYAKQKNIFLRINLDGYSEQYLQQSWDDSNTDKVFEELYKNQNLLKDEAQLFAQEWKGLMLQSMEILEAVEVNKNLPYISLLGDKFCDRGAEDSLILNFCKILGRSGAKYEALLCNHGVQFLRQYLHGFDKDIIILYNNSDGENYRQFGNSFYGMRYSVSQGNLKLEDIEDLIHKYYLSKLKLLSFNFNQEKNVVELRSHAPITAKKFIDMAGIFNIDLAVSKQALKDPILFKNIVDKINNILQDIIQKDKKLFLELLNSDQIGSWTNGRYEEILTEKNPYDYQFEFLVVNIHGHVGNESQFYSNNKNIFYINLDSNVGKPFECLIQNKGILPKYISTKGSPGNVNENQSAIVTFGNMEGNALSIFHSLIESKIIELPVKKYEQFIEYYYKTFFTKERIDDFKTELDEIFKVLKEYYKSFRAIQGECSRLEQEIENEEGLENKETLSQKLEDKEFLIVQIGKELQKKINVNLIPLLRIFLGAEEYCKVQNMSLDCYEDVENLFNKIIESHNFLKTHLNQIDQYKNSEENVNILDDFNDCIATLSSIEKIERSNEINFMGGLVGGRGLNEFLTLSILKVLNQKKINYTTLLCDDGINFLKKFFYSIENNNYEKYFDKSPCSLKDLLHKKYITLDVLKNDIYTYYVSKLKLLSFHMGEDNIIQLFSYAPLMAGKIIQMAKFLDIGDEEIINALQTPFALEKLIVAMNDKFSKIANDPEKLRYFLEEDVLEWWVTDDYNNIQQIVDDEELGKYQFGFQVINIHRDIDDKEEIEGKDENLDFVDLEDMTTLTTYFMKLGIEDFQNKNINNNNNISTTANNPYSFHNQQAISRQDIKNIEYESSNGKTF